MSQLLQNALYGTVMILVVAVLRRALRDRLVPGARLALWAACLFRLLTPAAPESVLSLWGLSRLFAPERQSAPAPAPASQLYVFPQAVPAAQPDPGISWETALFAGWLAVGAALAVWYALGWMRSRRAVFSAIPLDRDDPRYASLPKCARLREGPMEGAPLTFGVVRPTVVLSPGLDGEELACVLAHEGVHAVRRDNLWHYATALALAVHWWNPAVWLMSRLLRRDIELSCDRAALKRLGENHRADYANALVTLATQADGPAFCQTFGRKAAEERIRSIMKFKKISVIGVIFTLALVLAVTVAFASEPKTDDGTIQFHGETFLRSELSQETLDWLEWYLALPEEEQLAVSYVPTDLIRGPAPGVHDAADEKTGPANIVWGPAADEKTDPANIVWVPNVEKTKDIQSDFPEVDPEDVDLSMMRERLARKVAAGELTQAAADGILADTESMLEQARRGELKLFMYTDQNGEEFLYGSYVSTMYYKDEDGKLHPIDPSSVSGESYVLEPGRIQGYTGYSGNIQINDYDVKLPTFDEDGNPVADGVIGSRFYDYETVTDPDAVSGSVTGSDPAPVPSAGPEPVTAQPLANTAPFIACGEAGCTVSGEHFHENGKVAPVSHYETPLVQACPVEGCDEITSHQHNGRWSCFMHYVCPVEGCTMPGEHIHDGVPYSCNGAHSGGVCDGTCLVYSQPMQSAGNTNSSTSGHHSESHSSGHHGNGHH